MLFIMFGDFWFGIFREYLEFMNAVLG